MDANDLENYFKIQLDNGETLLWFVIMGKDTIQLKNHNLKEYPFVNLLEELKGWEFDEPSADNPYRLPKFKLSTKE